MFHMANVKKKLIIVFLILALAGVDFCNFPIVRADTASEINKSLDSLDKKRKAAQAELAAEQSKLYKNQSQITQTKSLLNSIIEDINRKEAELRNLNDRAELNRTMLAEYMRQIYYNNEDNDPLVNLSLFQGDLSDMGENSDNMVSIKNKISDALQVIQDAKMKTEQTKSELADQQVDHQETLKTQQVVQAQIADDIQDTQDTLANIQKKFDQLQGDLNRLLGTNYNAKDIKDAVGFASDKTGVPKGFLVGVLKMETNLGANVGGCTYGQVESGAQASYKSKKLGPKAWATFQTRRNTFMSICKELKIDYQKQKVSCNPKGYTGTGGAMGVAQFMPDTWNAYKKQVSSIAGHNPPSPWNLTDGVLAMALKLKRTPGVTSGSKSAFKSAACSYLGTCYAPYINGILYWADNYKQLI
jgi:peptidoglycan hydrolase CwlO-like protein